MSEPDYLPRPSLHDWAVPSHGLQVETIDAHVGGQSVRLILSGVPALRGQTMGEREEYARKHFDHLRCALLCEPRGHADLMGCLLTPPQRPGSHFGVLFMHRSGFSPICAEGVIALTTILLECGLVEMKAPETRLRLDTPAGMIRAYGQIGGDQVERVFFENAPARVVATGRRITVPEWGEVPYDLAFAGSLLALVSVEGMQLSTAAGAVGRLVAAGTALLGALASNRERQGSGEPVDQPVTGVIFMETPLRRRKETADVRQVCVFADGRVDRSPGGMAICARLALLSHRGEILDGATLMVEGMTGSAFRGRIVGHDPDPGNGGVICEIEGQAWITGRHTFLISPDDPFRSGFLL